MTRVTKMGKEHELLDAARNGDIAKCKKLLDQAIKKTPSPFSGFSFRRSLNLNHQDKNGYTALHHACLNGHEEVVRLLLKCHVVPDVSDVFGSTPLYLAAWAGYHEIVRILLTEPIKRINVNVQTSDNETPLHCAAQHGHDIVLEILLNHGSDPTIKNNSFQTALDLAAHFGRLSIVKILINRHPELLDPYRRNLHSPKDFAYDNDSVNKHIFTHTCLHLASRHGHKQVVEALLAAGVDVNIMTHAGTALHEAVSCMKHSIVSILLRAGVDIHVLDGNGQTALDLLKGYPPHVTYTICTMIKEYSTAGYFIPKVNSNLHNDDEILEEKSFARESESDAVKYTTLRFSPCLMAKQTHAEHQTLPKKSNVRTSGQYVQMRKIEPVSSVLNESQTNHNGHSRKNNRCVDEYVVMSTPDFIRRHKPPVPNPRHQTNGNNYANVDIVFNHSNSRNSNNFKTDNNNNATHSPTPEFPPPSVTEAEHSILEFIHPQNGKSKRSSLRLSQESELNLNAYLVAPSPVESSRSNASDYVEKFVGDVPFAGLFKGSTLNLNDDDNGKDRYRLRSPGLVNSIVAMPLKKQATLQNLNAKTDAKIDLGRDWQEINAILNSIDSEFTNPTDDTTEHNNQTNNVQMCNPSDLQLRTSRYGAVKNWCHAPNTLIYGQIIYRVYYLGSTIIRELHGTLSTRKSIQKLKYENDQLEKELDAKLVKGCNKLTRILKENNEQKRHQVEISISCGGVSFIDIETKMAISLHAIENINCVCQDTDDSRYFAYITMEKNMHYCHVFMVENKELATEITLSLGQAFAVAYHLAINNKEDSMN